MFAAPSPPDNPPASVLLALIPSVFNIVARTIDIVGVYSVAAPAYSRPFSLPLETPLSQQLYSVGEPTQTDRSCDAEAENLGPGDTHRVLASEVCPSDRSEVRWRDGC